MFVIPLHRDGTPLSRQIYSALRAGVLSGELSAGERLPSTRELSDQLSVSRTVVLMAYDQLLAEGFVVGQTGSGTFVATLPTTGKGRTKVESAQLHLSGFGSIAASAADRVGRALASRSLPYDFSYRSSPGTGFPMAAWQRILARRIRRAPLRSYEYAHSSGKLDLRQAIAAHLRRSRAVVCDASQIVIVNGSQQALDLAARVLLERGDRVAIEDPHYLGARDVFLAAGAKLHPVPVDHDGIDTARLPRAARLAFITPSHQFPTGTILPLPRRLALLGWAKRVNAVIVEDDYDGEFRYEGQPVESLQGLDTEGRVIYVGTFSRSMFPSMRIGYLIAPKSLVPAFTAAKWLCDRHTATLEQEALAEFITSGAYERHLRRARKANAERRRILLGAISEYMGDRAEITGDGAGAHIVIWPRRHASEEKFALRAAEQGVGVYGICEHFLAEKPAQPGLLLGYAHIRKDFIREGIRRLAEIL
jgi:GntR family transcriptional regulator / MocR family aminotransferase